MPRSTSAFNLQSSNKFVKANPVPNKVYLATNSYFSDKFVRKLNQ